MHTWEGNEEPLPVLVSDMFPTPHPTLKKFTFHLSHVPFLPSSLTQGSFRTLSPKALTHEATKAVKGSGNSSLGVHFNQHVLLCVDINLQQASSVQGTVHQHQ